MSDNADQRCIGLSVPGATDHLDRLEAMKGVEGAAGVHDLHVWTITSGMVALSAHVLPGSECDRDDLLKSLSDTLKQRFAICHVTIQIESPAHDCEPCF